MHGKNFRRTFANAKANYVDANAQMAELVDALVSNTSGVKSIPVRSRVWVQKLSIEYSVLSFSFHPNFPHIFPARTRIASVIHYFLC